MENLIHQVWEIYPCEELGISCGQAEVASVVQEMESYPAEMVETFEAVVAQEKVIYASWVMTTLASWEMVTYASWVMGNYAA